MLVAVLSLAAAWLLACAGLFFAMTRTPAGFGRIMSHVPMPAFLLFPFRTMWSVARGGTLSPGDAAPDFELPRREGEGTVRLSSFRGRKPVVLVFGSYT